MPTRAERKRLLQELLHTTCREMQWGSAARTPDEISLALAAYRLDIVTPGVDLRARITDAMELEIALDVRLWDADTEDDLLYALEECGSILARLVMAEWELVRSTCTAASRTRGKRLLLTAVTL